MTRTQNMGKWAGPIIEALLNTILTLEASVVQVRGIKLWPPPHICQSVLVMSPQCLHSWAPDSGGEEVQQQEQGLTGENPDTEVGLN